MRAVAFVTDVNVPFSCSLDGQGYLSMFLRSRPVSLTGSLFPPLNHRMRGNWERRAAAVMDFVQTLGQESIDCWDYRKIRLCGVHSTIPSVCFCAVYQPKEYAVAGHAGGQLI